MNKVNIPTTIKNHTNTIHNLLYATNIQTKRKGKLKSKESIPFEKSHIIASKIYDKINITRRKGKKAYQYQMGGTEMEEHKYRNI